MNLVMIDRSINEGYYSQQTFSSNSYLSESRLMANNVMLEDHQSVWKCRRGNAQFNKFQRGLVVTKKYFLVLEDSVGEKELKKFRVGGNSHFMMSRTARHLLNFCFSKISVANWTRFWVENNCKSLQIFKDCNFFKKQNMKYTYTNKEVYRVSS